MRGSPILRFILLAIALVATAVGLRQVTSVRVAPASVRPIIKSESSGIRVPFRLMLSAPASIVEINTGKTLRPSTEENPFSGTLEISAENPHVALIVRWKTPPSAGEHRFAKLTLEPPGQETAIHVFDSDGDIDDFIELPLPAAKNE